MAAHRGRGPEHGDRGNQVIEVSKIRIDGGTQSRAAINEQTVAEYAEAMEDPATVFPPLVVYYDGRDYWLADGFHRLAAWQRIGRVEVPAEVRQGDRRRAILHSCAANAAHGLRRTNDDKRRAVMTLLEDAEWSQWSNREIARRCGVHYNFVGKLRADVTITPSDSEAPRTYTTKHGTEAQMDTSRIGKAEADPPLEYPEPACWPVVDHEPASGDTQAPLPVTDERKDETEDHDPVHAEKLDAEPDPHAAVRKALRALTREGLEDEVIGLREENGELRKRVKKQTGEIADLKMKLKEATSEDMGRALGNAQRQRDTLSGRVNEHLATIKRMEYRLKKAEERVAELEKMAIPL
jgi:hypothetical protein